MFLGHFFNIRWLTDCKKLQIHGIFFRTSSTCGIFVDPQLKFCIFCSDRTENLYGLSRRCHLGAGIGVYWTPKTKDISFLFPSTHHLIHKIVVVFCCETSDWYIHAGNWVTWSIVTISFLGHLVLLGLFFWTLLSFFETSFERWWKKDIARGDHLGLRAAEGNPSIVPAQSGSENPKKTTLQGWDFGIR